MLSILSIPVGVVYDVCFEECSSQSVLHSRVTPGIEHASSHVTSWWHVSSSSSDDKLSSPEEEYRLRTPLQDLPNLYHSLQNSCGYEMAMKLEFFTQIGRCPTSPAQLSRVFQAFNDTSTHFLVPVLAKNLLRLPRAFLGVKLRCFCKHSIPQFHFRSHYERRDKPYFDQA